MTTATSIALTDDDGVHLGSFSIECLPGSEAWHGLATLELTDQIDPTNSNAKPQLLEETDYAYRIELVDDSLRSLEPKEVFSPDTTSFLSGRLRPGRSTGTIRIEVETKAGRRCVADIEVRSRKLDYETEYRRMMLRLAEEGAELLQSSFAAGSFAGFNPDQAADARTLYQRFAFLESLVDSEGFAEAIDIIRYRPHTRHESMDGHVNPVRSMKADPGLARQLVRSTVRQPVSRPVGGMHSIPRRVVRRTHAETFDTEPNRFVRFALENWRRLAVALVEALPATGLDADRGRRSARRIEARLDHLLNIPALAEAGELARFPAGNTVLSGRAGYREIMRSFLIGEIATSLSWDGGDDVFSAGKRDVATLYEYWVFLELARIIESLPGLELDRSELVTETRYGLGLDLRRGRECVVTGQLERRGRRVSLELWFNRTFQSGHTGAGSWTVDMRPDCSLRIRPEGGRWASDTWIHFDAKYRMTMYASMFRADEQAGPDWSPATPGSGPKTDDLRKMHAYRDAIRRTAGAYVLYPGDDQVAQEPLRQYHEVLPGLGAFVLRPSSSGEATVLAARRLTSFITDVIDHAADQGTGRERAWFWENVAYSAAEGNQKRQDFDSALNLPPADSTVMLGYVRSSEHLRWIRDQGLYNLRADPDRAGSVQLGSPALTAQFVLLYDRSSDSVACFRTTGALFVRTGAELRASGYPTGVSTEGSGAQYLCLEIGEPINSPITGSQARALAPSDGSPSVVTWDQLPSGRAT